MASEQLRALRALGRAQEVFAVAAGNLSRCVDRAMKAGCRQADIAIELDVTRQAVHNKLKRAQSAKS